MLIEELESIISDPALKEDWPDDEKGRVTKPLAYMLYAEMVMLQNDNSRYSKALGFMETLINSGRFGLMDNYEDIFRGSNNTCPESLIAWRWTVGAHWTCQNSLQSDLAIEGMCEVGSVWGGWGGPSTDLMEAFGILRIEGQGADARLVEWQSPESRADIDTRRKATMMIAGDKYSYFWRDKGGFDYLRFI